MLPGWLTLTLTLTLTLALSSSPSPPSSSSLAGQVARKLPVAASGFPISQEKGGMLDESTPLEFDIHVLSLIPCPFVPLTL